MMQHSSIIVLLSTTFNGMAWCFHAEGHLYSKLMSDYNKLIRPVKNYNETLTVFIGLRMSSLMDVAMKNQLMTTNVWVELEWNDRNLVWEPAENGGVTQLYVPSEKLWLPDIVLYNNADGNYQFVIQTKATVYSDGKVKWVPPAIFKSACQINVEWFPFDSQVCGMTFGSWTYDESRVNVQHILQNKPAARALSAASDIVYIDLAVNVGELYDSGEWDITQLSGQRRVKTFYGSSIPELVFEIHVRRKILFYFVNLILPCMAVSCLTLLVFYLPSETGEKLTLGVNVLLSLTFFILILAETIPETSVVVPLIGKLLLFTLILVAVSITATVSVLNVHFRTPDMHEMPKWCRSLFLEMLPRLLCMRQPRFSNDRQIIGDILNSSSYVPSRIKFHRRLPAHSYVLKMKMKTAVCGVRYIAEHMRESDKDSTAADDWKYIARVLDRFFLWFFCLLCFLVASVIIFQAPSLYDKSEPLTKATVPNQTYIKFYAKQIFQGKIKVDVD